MPRMIRLTNSFHGTSQPIPVAADGTVSRHTERRAWRGLCGIRGCCCSGYGGVRGGDYRLTPSPGLGAGAFERFVVEERTWNDEFAVWDYVPLTTEG